MKKQMYLIIALILFLLVAIISVLNVGVVPLNFGFTSVEWPLIFIILGSLIIGALIASIFAGIKVFQYENKINRLKRELNSQTELGISNVEKTEYQYQDKVDDLELTIQKKDQRIAELERENSNLKSNR